jgi:hypothetical protein
MRPVLAPFAALWLASLACVDATPPRAQPVVLVADPPRSSPFLPSTAPVAAPNRPVVEPAAALPSAPANSPAAPAERGTRVASMGSVVYLPHALALVDGGFDLVLHFHGDTRTAEDQLDAAGLDAVLSTVNLGVGSSAYDRKYQDGAALDATLRAVERSVARAKGVPGAHVRRVAISAWSAGYAAVLRILAHPEAAARVDAVFLADGPHAMFTDEHLRTIDEHRLAPLAAFARRAMAGDVLAAFTHSAIRTIGYASTTETTSWLLGTLSLDRTPAGGADGPLHLASSADHGAFHLRGYTGDTARDHCDHLQSIGRTLWPWLRERWAKGP